MENSKGEQKCAHFDDEFIITAMNIEYFIFRNKYNFEIDIRGPDTYNYVINFARSMMGIEKFSESRGTVSTENFRKFEINKKLFEELSEEIIATLTGKDQGTLFKNELRGSYYIYFASYMRKLYTLIIYHESGADLSKLRFLI